MRYNKVTIITSVLNGDSTIERCIESVANQTYSCEHIIVDAGSTDGTLEIIEKYDNIILISAPRSSISQAFNIGIERAMGEVIGILNADDWYELDAVERSIAALNSNIDTGFSYGSVIVHDNERNTIVSPVASAQIKQKSLRYMPFCHISSFVRRDIYKSYGMFDLNYSVAMDFDFYARIISQGVRGVPVAGIIGHVDAGGKSSVLRHRLPEYLAISSQYLGLQKALYYLIVASARGYVYNYINKKSLMRKLARKFGFWSRSKEVV